MCHCAAFMLPLCIIIIQFFLCVCACVCAKAVSWQVYYAQCVEGGLVREGLSYNRSLIVAFEIQ